MEIVNYTPFVPWLQPVRDKDDQDFWVVILKATLRIVAGGTAVAAAEQIPILYADEYRGDPLTTSLVAEADTSPLKPRTDVMFRAVARSPSPAREWNVRAAVGPLEKRLHVTGPRRWVRTLGSYELTDPIACTEVPIRYELAFGGVYEDSNGVLHALHENPVGVGYIPEGHRPRAELVVAPQIEDPADPMRQIGRPHVPQGLGPMARAWLPRRARAGTFDERWKKERWPNVPLDFDDSFYNAAHPDLVAPRHLTGGEEVVLEGLGPRPTRFYLPRFAVTMLAPPDPEPRAAALDTVFIDAEAGKVVLRWAVRLRESELLETIRIHARAA